MKKQRTEEYPWYIGETVRICNGAHPCNGRTGRITEITKERIKIQLDGGVAQCTATRDEIASVVKL